MRGWEDNIKMCPKQITCASVDWIYLATDRVQTPVLANTLMNIRVPHTAGIFFDQLTYHELFRKDSFCIELVLFV